jgi:hypothetical protein
MVLYVPGQAQPLLLKVGEQDVYPRVILSSLEEKGNRILYNEKTEVHY